MHEAPAIARRLKHETAAAHRELEAVIAIDSWLETRAAYRALLGRFWGFYAALEARLADRPEWAAHGMDLRPRLKLPLLARDLAALREPGDAPPPICAAPPALGSFAAALGGLYVLEGATLDGQFIARQARERLGLGPDAGLSFFLSYGADVGPMWRGFQQWLARAATTEADAAPPASGSPVGGASATFAAFASWWGACGGPR